MPSSRSIAFAAAAALLLPEEAAGFSVTAAARPSACALPHHHQLAPPRYCRMAPAEMMADATTLEAFLKTISDDASAVDFEDTMAAIEDGYDYAAVAFKCGAVDSAADQNQGSAKIFSFAKLQELDEATTLQLFGRFYRKDVLENPDGDDHGNIRNFIKSGWGGVDFPDGLALTPK